MRRTLLALLSIAVIAITPIASLLDRYGRRAPPNESFDAIVVLGCRVQPSGAPSAALRRRVERAVQLWRDGRAPTIVLTGGVGEHSPSEALVEATLARSLGVPERALLIEDASTSTEENARFAAERFGGKRVLLVSDAYHVFRAERVFRKYYAYVRGTGTQTPASDRKLASWREVLACTAYWVLGRIDLLDRTDDDPPNVSPLLDRRTPGCVSREPGSAEDCLMDDRRRSGGSNALASCEGRALMLVPPEPMPRPGVV